jgi:hypothetical protein
VTSNGGNAYEATLSHVDSHRVIVEADGTITKAELAKTKRSSMCSGRWPRWWGETLPEPTEAKDRQGRFRIGRLDIKSGGTTKSASAVRSDSTRR